MNTEIKTELQKSTFEINGLKVKIALVDITPEVAESLLSKNSNNRTLSPSNVKFLTNEILNGNWQFDGQPIRIDYNGNLLDGQHRLNSIIKSGEIIKCFVIFGLRPETFKVMDTGKIRTASDVLSIEKISNSSYVATSLKLLDAIKAGIYSGHKRRTLSNTEVLEYYENNMGISNSVNYVKSVSRNFKSIVSVSILSTLHYLFSEISESDANEFIGKLCSGSGLNENSPILVLRNKLIKANSSDKNKLTKKDIIGNIILGWNKYREGEEIKMLSLKKDFDFIAK